MVVRGRTGCAMLPTGTGGKGIYHLAVLVLNRGVGARSAWTTRALDPVLCFMFKEQILSTIHISPDVYIPRPRPRRNPWERMYHLKV